MPPTKGILWNYFLAGEKQNGSHIQAHYRGCIEKEQPIGETIELNEDGNLKLSSESWIIAG